MRCSLWDLGVFNQCP